VETARSRHHLPSSPDSRLRYRPRRPDATLLARTPLVASASAMRAFERRRLEQQHRKRLLRWDAVPRFDVSKRGRQARWAGGLGLAARTALPSVAALPAVWPFMVAMGYSKGVRSEVSNAG
jgi:hypothetical protein